MKILSLFDGMACWYEALQRAWIKIEQYYASEIDKYAIQIATKNHPDIIEIWDVTKIKYNWWWIDYERGNTYTWQIDLLIWWSPCQWFSVAWKMLNFNDPRSKLFFEYVRILKEVKPRYFLLENVKMKKEWQDIISRELWVEPIEINSSLVSAQNRRRLYRTNIPSVSQPTDKGILLKDILEENVDEKYYLSDKWLKMLNRNFWSKGKALNFEPSMIEKITYPSRINQIEWWLDIKTPTLTASMWTWWWNVPCLLEIRGGELRVKQATKQWYIVANDGDGISLAYPNSTTRRWRVIHWKSNTLTTEWESHVYTNSIIRKLTPIECERLQTLEDNYTAGVSDSQRYKMLWNWWTVDVIAHIFRFIH